MTVHEFCTYFDRGYLARALVLHDSLVATGIPFRLTALCLDDEAYRAINVRSDPTLVPLAIQELEGSDPDLLAVKPTRSRYEYFFTLGPSLIRHLLDGHGLSQITYLDADMRFYASPEPLFEEAADAAVVIVGHRFPRRLRHLEETGRFNVAWVGFSDDADARACLEWWRERCLEWCFDRVEPTRYADQKYLDEFPRRFNRVHELHHPGADVAPWNLADPPLEWDGQRFLVAGEPLVFFHFQGFKRDGGWIDPNLAEYGNRPNRAVRRLYRDYALLLSQHSGTAISPRRSSAEARASLGRRLSDIRDLIAGHRIRASGVRKS